MVVIKLILCAIPYKEGCVWNNGMGMWVGFVLDPRYAVCFVLADAVRRMDLSVKDSMKLGELLLALAVAMGAVGEMSCCGSTGCLSCRGKQSTSSSLSLSGRSLLLLLDLFF